ncbi:hypothetical protein FQR65_LT17982 [Abscondita terminalis]|nr:hypothetical protein FQR65_LT17982 [Abscondita terminalis]
MPGSVAANFEFVDSAGKNQNLHQIGSPEKLLVFYDPECSHCAEAVVAVSPVEDFNKWKGLSGKYSGTWINWFDKKGDLKQKELYDIKAFPTIYLLDKNNKVILKDASLEQVLSLLKI